MSTVKGVDTSVKTVYTQDMSTTETAAPTTARRQGRDRTLFGNLFLTYVDGRCIGVVTGTSYTARSIRYSGIDTDGRFRTMEKPSARQAAIALAEAVR